ncbi:MAG TPA: C4-dicarboxylate ABC transporter permease, partial [Synergistaceae bacterium]|nr:C4-dicarboxylate ABC transporter permease [Synergistaceae bacterium]
MNWLWPEALYAFLMIGTFVLGAFRLKLPIAVAMALAAVVGGLAAVKGLPVRHLVEGTFGYLDTILIIATAMIFMKVIERTGLLEAMAAW